jgi:carbonic anhydrase/acetyltransferase-like protein (isoleucine patch superfamily)
MRKGVGLKMIMPFKEKFPKIDPTAFVAENATIIGDVEIGPGTNVWFYSLVRGDQNTIRIGSNCSIQDGSILHVEYELPLIIEDEVAFGHRVIAHACTIKRGSLIGIGAIVLNGAVIEEESIVGAGSVVTPNTVIPPRMLALGNPAKPVRPLKEKDFALIRRTLNNYQGLRKIYQSASPKKPQ